MTKNEMIQIKIEKNLKELAKKDAKLLNKKDVSDYMRFLIEIGHLFAVTQINHTDDYIITEEKINEFIDKRLGRK